MFSAVDAVLLQPLPYQEPGRLVRLYQSWTGNPGDRSFVTPVHYLAFRDQLSSFDGVAAILTYNASGADIGSGDDVRRIRLLPTSANYFDVVRVQPVAGSRVPGGRRAGTRHRGRHRRRAGGGPQSRSLAASSFVVIPPPSGSRW